MKKYFYMLGILLVGLVIIFSALSTPRYSKIEIFNLSARGTIMGQGSANKISVHGRTVPDTEIALLVKHSKYYTLVDKNYSDNKGGFSLKAFGGNHRQKYVVTISKVATSLNKNEGKFIRLHQRSLSENVIYYPSH